MSHLENIATRQRHSLVRDTVFVAFLTLATVVSAFTVRQAVQASAHGSVAQVAPVCAR
ncbi:MAG TPA: hypothetical protein VFP84_22010 [Kofleriaceae bacterium]|nr:hypothetical protein [Kofleriaceae bacterium]